MQTVVVKLSNVFTVQNQKTWKTLWRHRTFSKRTSFRFLLYRVQYPQTSDPNMSLICISSLILSTAESTFTANLSDDPPPFAPLISVRASPNAFSNGEIHTMRRRMEKEALFRYGCDVLPACKILQRMKRRNIHLLPELSDDLVDQIVGDLTTVATTHVFNKLQERLSKLRLYAKVRNTI